MAGTVGAIFNGALQLGSAIGISAVGSIKSSVEDMRGGPSSYSGCASAYLFLLGIVGAEFIALLVFYRVDKEGMVEDGEMLEKAKTLEELEEANIVKEKVNAEVDIKVSREQVFHGAQVARDSEMDVSEMPALPGRGDENV